MSRTRLGYGTSLLMGRVGERESRRLLECAFDAGITHFDTARLYGYGETERVVGQFARGRRDRVTLATKAGISPPKRSITLTALRAAARGLVKLAPSLRASVRAQASKLNRPGQFTPESVGASLETSLRELQTDYIDVFLLHECSVDDLTDELYELLADARSRGRIRAFGVAVKPVDSADIVRERPEFTQVLQIPDSLCHPRETDVDTRLITHSIFSGLSGQAPAETSNRRRAMLEYALQSNPEGIVLFSSLNASHIAENVAASDRLVRSLV